MFDSKMLLVILAIALVIFGTKRLRSIGTDLGAAVKGFKQAMNDGESEEQIKHLKQEKDADFTVGATAGAAPSASTGVGTGANAAAAARDAEAKATPKTSV